MIVDFKLKICYFSVVLFLSACGNRSSVIEGTLPSDNYDGQTVYWVPIEGEHPKPVDSTHIQNNTFRLVVSARNLNKMGVVRLKPQLRIEIQEILVFTEPGTVRVALNNVSNSSGTPLNDALQNWKNKKRTYDMEIFALNKKRMSADSENEIEIKEAIENTSAAYRDYVYETIVDNKDNEVGKFIYSFCKSSLTPEQTQLIDKLIM